MKTIIKSIFGAFGYDIVRRTHASSASMRLLSLLKAKSINCVIDIGANTGQYAQYLRTIGYKQTIISFEPLSSAYVRLKENASKDVDWITINCGVGDENKTANINVAGNSTSSSFLDMMPIHEEVAPVSHYTHQEKVEVVTLDSVYPKYVLPESRTLLKIDAQGYEKKILSGSKQTLDKVVALQMEMSMVQLYSGSQLYLDSIEFMKDIGFSLWATENVLCHPDDGRVLQMDGLFVRE